MSQADVEKSESMVNMWSDVARSNGIPFGVFADACYLAAIRAGSHVIEDPNMVLTPPDTFIIGMSGEDQDGKKVEYEISIKKLDHH